MSSFVSEPVLQVPTRMGGQENETSRTQVKRESDSIIVVMEKWPSGEEHTPILQAA